MRRVLALIAASTVVVLSAAVSASASPLHTQVLYIDNSEGSVPQADVANALPAFQTAVDRDFGPAWNQYATLQLLQPGEKAPPRAWVIHLTDNLDCDNCLGYHSANLNGVPYARVFPGISADYNVPWEVVFTHELFELLADPYVDRVAAVTRRGRTSFHYLEVGDPVEAFFYMIPGADGRAVPITDFVFDKWWAPGSKGPYDFMDLVGQPLQILGGGYEIICDRTGCASTEGVFRVRKGEG